MTPQAAGFTPALGYRFLTPAYDAAVALFTRERRWRNALIRQIAPRAKDVIADVGCGTGTLAVMLKRHAPSVSVHGFAPIQKCSTALNAKRTRPVRSST
jgi:ubiquinone/menaquinone biosynthesis C-methylase UbiE